MPRSFLTYVNRAKTHYHSSVDADNARDERNAVRRFNRANARAVLAWYALSRSERARIKACEGVFVLRGFVNFN